VEVVVLVWLLDLQKMVDLEAVLVLILR
jgi:hypothetical protein